MHNKISQVTTAAEGEDVNAGGDHVNDSDFEIDNEFDTESRTSKLTKIIKLK